jgi:hypothetical protein
MHTWLPVGQTTPGKKLKPIICCAHVQNFTRDRAALLKALKDQSVHYAWKLEGDKSIGYGAVERLDQSLSALEQIAQASARIPGRKNLVWVGQGFPTPDPTELDMKDQNLVSGTMQHVTDVLLNTRVTLYAVDSTGGAAGMTVRLPMLPSSNSRNSQATRSPAMRIPSTPAWTSIALVR